MPVGAVRALVLVTLAALATGVAAAPDTVLSELQRTQVEAHRLRVDNAQLRARVAELQAEIDGLRLTAERAELEQRLREAIKPAAGSVFNWQTLTFESAKEPPQ